MDSKTFAALEQKMTTVVRIVHCAINQITTNQVSSFAWLSRVT